jgi:photosystem II stability/assembly factor-like uncharacterized protein
VDWREASPGSDRRPGLAGISKAARTTNAGSTLRILEYIIVVGAISVMLVIRLDAQATSWQWLNPLPQGNGLNAVKAIDANISIAVGYDGTVIKTTSGGVSWFVQTSVGGSGYFNGISFLDSNNGTIVGWSGSPAPHGTILRTSDGGVTWISQISGTPNALFSVFFTDIDHGVAVGEGGTILRTTNGGITWTSQASGSIDNLYGISFANSKRGLAVGGIDGVSVPKILLTNDGGTTWSTQLTDISSVPMSVAFADSKIGRAHV